MYTKVVLTAIAVFLGIMALRPMMEAPAVRAQSGDARYYIEPRTVTLRAPDGGVQVEGKMVIDLSNGDVWGFPTATNQPYPIDLARSAPPVSKAIYLGRFDFSSMVRAR